MSVPGAGLCIVKYKVASFVCSILCYLCCNGSCVCAQKHDFLNLSKNHEISKQNKRLYIFGAVVEPVGGCGGSAGRCAGVGSDKNMAYK